MKWCRAYCRPRNLCGAAPRLGVPSKSQIARRPSQDASGLPDMSCGLIPVLKVDSIQDSWEVRFIIATPRLRAKDDMLVLLSSWNLNVLSVLEGMAGCEYPGCTYSASVSQIQHISL